MEKVHLVTIATEGHPFDEGQSLVHLAEAYGKKSVQAGFASFAIVTPRSAGAFSHKVARKTRNRTKEMLLAERLFRGTRWKATWAATGFLRWKPDAILQRFDSADIQENELLVYHDCDWKSYPEYLDGLHDQTEFFLRETQNYDVLLFQDSDEPIRKGVKTELLLSRLLWEFPWQEIPGVWAGSLVVRKNARGRKFLKAWIRSCSPWAVTQATVFPRAKGFFWHTNEQACLSILWHRNQANQRRWRLMPLHGRAIPPRAFPSVST